MGTNTNALEFNGTSRYAKLSTASSLRGLENFTWMGWVKVGANSKNQYQRAYVERQGSGSGIRFAVTPFQGKLRFELAVRDGETDTNYDFSYTWDDYWHHVAFAARVSGTNPSYSIYLDGVEVASGKIVRKPEVEGDDTSRPVSDTAPLGSIYLGNHSLATSGESFPSDRFWHGKLDDIIIMKEAVNQTDILTYTQSNDHYPDDDDVGTEDDPMKSYYRFDNGTSATLTNYKSGIGSGTSYTSVGTSGNISCDDRPFLGDGLVDTSEPSQPSSPSTTNVTSDGFTASWNASTDNVYVQFYEFQLSQFSNFNSYVSTDVGRLTQKTVRNLLPNVNYYWRVRAYDAKLNVSTYSTVQSLTTPSIGDVTPPLPPTNLVASDISYSLWTLSWTPSQSSDETGYKLDIATDAGFTKFLSGYRNRDVGNVTTTNIFGATPITTYYVRLRAYDAASNESTPSSVLMLQTEALPDITAPLPVDTFDAASISSRGFTAMWDDGVDDTRVAGYYLDVSYDEFFTSFVQTDTNYWSNADVGNVTAIRVEGLEPQTLYFYRVRAYDAAGNVSDNSELFATVVTSPPSLDEGGFETSSLLPHVAFVVDEDTPTVIDDMTNDTMTVSSSTTEGEQDVFMAFELTPLVGRMESAMLRLFVTSSSEEPILHISVDDVVTEEATSWNDRPTLTSDELTATIFSVDAWVDVDISSLLTEGNTSYTLRLRTDGDASITFLSPAFEDESKRPELVVENDPQTSTQVQSLSPTDSPLLRRNFAVNPSFENGSTVGWFTNGVTTNIVTDTEAPHGTRYLAMTASSASGGIYTGVTNAFAEKGDIWTASVALRRGGGSISEARLIISEVDQNGSGLVNHIETISVTNNWLRFSLTKELVHEETKYVSFFINLLYSTGATMHVDAVLFEQTNFDSPFFDGSTSGAVWSGSANASTSTIPAARVTAVSQYVGDSNQNNVLTAMWKRVEDNEWIVIPDTHAVEERTLKYSSTVFGPAYGNYNLLLNPSFEESLEHWYAESPSTIERVGSVIAPSDYALSLSTVTGEGTVGTTLPINVATTPYLTAQAQVRASVGSSVRIRVRLHNEAGTVVEEEESDVTFGTGQFERVYATIVRDSQELSFATVQIRVENTDGTPAEVDQVQLQASDRLQPYRDGTHIDGIWQGTPNNSASGVMLMPNTEYVFAHSYFDEDGVYSSPSERVTTQAVTFVTAQAPDDALTVYPIETIPSHTSLFVSIPYAGDDNEDATCSLRYTRSDLNSWQSGQPVFDREEKRVFTTLTNLTPGTSYLIEATFSDPDGIFNTDNGVVEHTGVTTILSDSPDGAARVTYGGFVLQGRPDDKVHVSYHDAFGFSERRVQVENFPRIHGGIELENLWRPRTIRMEGVVEGDTPAELMDNLDALKRALALPKQRLIIDSLANRRRFYTATCTVLEAPQEAGRHYRHLNWDAEFLCADPFAYDATESTQPQITLSNTDVLSLSNDGDIAALPVITLGTASTNAVTVTILNETTGERITPASTIIRGDTLTIDSRRYSVQKNGVEIDYSGGFVTLGRGGNSIKAELLGAGTPSVLFSMRWYARYL